jgi:MFS family permease
MSGLLVNPVFVSHFFKNFGGADGSTSSVDPSITGISVACLQASAAVGALIAGRLGDMVGRKKCVRIGAFIYFFSAFIQMFAPGFATFVAGRTIQGLGVGFLSMTVPIIQTEIAAPHRRGLMVGIEYTFLIAGYMLSCWVDYGFNFLLPSEMSWRGPFIIQIILSFVLFVMSFFLPETPRWLAINGFMDESLQTIADLHSNGNTEDEQVQKVFYEIQEAVIYESNLGKSTWMVRLSCFCQSFGACGCLLQAADIGCIGNVYSIPQANDRWYHGSNVRTDQRNQHHLFLPSKHPCKRWVRQPKIPPVHRRERSSLHRSNNCYLVAGG